MFLCIRIACDKVVFIADDYRLKTLHLCLSKLTVNKSRAERRLIRCGYQNHVINVCRQKLRTPALYIPSDKFIFPWHKRHNLPLVFIHAVRFDFNNIARSKGIVIFLVRLEHLAFYRAAARYSVITFNFKNIISSRKNSTFHILQL